jgi:hypothetical protein
MICDEWTGMHGPASSMNPDSLGSGGYTSMLNVLDVRILVQPDHVFDDIFRLAIPVEFFLLMIYIPRHALIKVF